MEHAAITARDQRPRLIRQRGAADPIVEALVPIVGRDNDLQTLTVLLQDPTRRLISLVGPVGVGKSRLATCAASRLAYALPHGSCMVSLRAARQPADILAALSAAIEPAGAPAGAVTLAGLVERLHDRAILLVIDDCHHLRAEVADVVAELLGACRLLRVLVAGVEPLGIYGELLCAVRPLEVPSVGGTPAVEELAAVPSVALFLQRAAAVRPTFTLSDANAPVVAELCRALDGLPLAIELAASRLKILQPDELLAQVGRGLDALENTGITASVPHTRMRAALDVHWDQLPEYAQCTLASLGVFVGGFCLEAAQAVAAMPAEHARQGLELLIDRSFVLVDERSTTELRFSLLRTTRTYVLEQLAAMGALEAVERRHADFHLRRHPATAATGPEREAWLSTLDTEIGDMEAALDRLIRDRRGADATVLATALAPYWLAAGEAAEGLSWLDRAARAGQVPAAVVADGLIAAGELAAHTGSWVEASRLQHRALALHESVGDAAGVRAATHQLGVTAYLSGDLGRAQVLLGSAVEAYQAVGEQTRAAVASLDLAALRVALDDLPGAAECASAALAVLADAGAPYPLAVARARLAEIAVARGELAVAEDHCRAAIVTLTRLRDWGTVGLALELLAAVLAGDGALRHQRAIRLLGAAHACRERYKQPPSVPRRGLIQGLAYRLHNQVDSVTYGENWRSGIALSPVAALREPGRAARVVRPAGRLTPRQQQVAELVACGLTNREIARRLGVAEWTVVNHVRQVLRKLQVSSRVHVARWFAEQQSA